ncbi:MAG: NAD(P)-binding domain-containing protein [Bacteroidia bacterium]|nr:NAD(P)-binding domain-containing protein [Bacteroidia bacterium]
MTIGVIGSGAMGSGIAQVAATAGHEVFVYDNNSAALDKSKTALQVVLNRLVEKQKLAKEAADDILKHIKYVSSLSDLKSCGLVVEAIIENLSVKQKVFSELETIVQAECILASNTSSLSITSIASGCTKPERVIGIHFFNPAPLMPLVEIIPGLATSDEVTVGSKKMIDSWGKTTVLAKDTPGFIVNRVARPFYGEAIRIYEEGFADFATIDWAMKEFGGFKMGPFELMDMIGNDINYTVTETVWTQMFFDQRYKPSLTQKRLFEAKRFGRKSGQGYYNYSEGASIPQPKKDEELGQGIFHRVLYMLINEAADALYLKIASKEDIDLAMTKGVNYPKGLLKWADQIGVEKISDVLQDMYDEYAEDRYRPSVLIKRMAADKITFY